MLNACDIKKLMQCWAEVMVQNRDYLIELDSHVGDSDLGLTMGDGFTAASNAIADLDESDIGKLVYNAGKAMSTAVPSTMGTLMASGLMAVGKTLKGCTDLDMDGIVSFFQSYFDGVQSRGKAQVGDKTFLDGLFGAVESLKTDAAANLPLKEAAEHASQAAHQGFLNTKGMLAQFGRAAGRGEQSRDLLDPGAAVADLLMKGFAIFISEKADSI
jgi:dihydroxyacetone kinase-like protein